MLYAHKEKIFNNILQLRRNSDMLHMCHNGKCEKYLNGTDRFEQTLKTETEN